MLAIFALSINAFAQDTNKPQVITRNLTITGIIKNFKEFVDLIVPDVSFIQLVPVHEYGRISNSTDSEGRLSFTSNLQ